MGNMKQEDIQRMAHDIVDRCGVENDYIEYKKSVSFQDKILKTACAYANNYMNREIGLIFIGIEEVDDKDSGEKAVPVRPISGIDEAQIESTENILKSLMSHIHPKPDYKLIQDTDYIPYAYVEIIREAIGTDKMESKIFDGPIWIQAQQVLRYFKNEIEASYNVRDNVTNETHVVYNWPEIMFSEIAINCILHKEYSRGNYVGIYWYRDHLTFINHNRPLPPVTIQDLNEKTEFADRQYLNKELKDMFFALNLIQSYGSGIRRAKRAMVDNHSPELVFEPKDEDEKDYTQVTAYINEEFATIRQEEKEETNTTKRLPKKLPKRQGILSFI